MGFERKFRRGLSATVLDAFRYRRLAKATRATDGVQSDEQKAIGDSVMNAMKEHGIDPSSPDPARLMDPEVQRALREATLRHKPKGGA